LIYSSTGAAYRGVSVGKTDKGGSPVLQGHKDLMLRMWRDAGKREKKSPREVVKTRDSGLARRPVTQETKTGGY
jgi:hypothetical protein